MPAAIEAIIVANNARSGPVEEISLEGELTKVRTELRTRQRETIMAIKPVPFEIEKTYPPRGPLQQYRLAQSAAFTCFRCGESKKSKLITLYGEDWSRRLCNGCYGRLLSIFVVKAG